MEDFNRQLLAEVHGDVRASGIFVQDVFFDRMAGRLAAAGELETHDRAAAEGIFQGKSYKIDGYGGDPRESSGVLSVMICDFQEQDGVQKMNAADANQITTRLVNFVSLSRTAAFRESLRPGSAAQSLAELIAATWRTTVKVKLILITNAVNSSRRDAVPAGKIGEVSVTYNIWDLSRFHRFEDSGRAKEDIEVDFKEFGGSIPALRASSDNDELESYLAVIPGRQLGLLYDKYGARLLEANVRSFLQVRGKVNKGIRETIRTQPAVFFPYNNGLSVTADAIQTDKDHEGLKIVSATNLQIVNGGQTTASLGEALRTNLDALDKVRVQMKVTVVPPDRSEEIVPRISEFANSQNTVSAADFFSNHPFHIRIEEFSRRILAPAPEGSSRETKWFYERARGQYPVARNKLSEGNRRRFDQEFPKEQLFAKTDVAKAEFSFRGKPEIVSRGAQKNFSKFAEQIGEEWTKFEDFFDDTWYRRLIAKLIVFKKLETVIPKQPWYVGGFRANIVTYAIAKLCADTKARGLAIDLDAVWRDQSVSKELEASLLQASQIVTGVITNPPADIRNVTEWAKKQACWEAVKRIEVDYGDDFDAGLISKEDAQAVEKEGRRDAGIVSGIEAQRYVFTKGPAFWEKLRAWALANRSVTPKEAGILEVCAAAPAKIPSEKQSQIAIEILDRATDSGFSSGVDDRDPIRLKGWRTEH